MRPTDVQSLVALPWEVQNSDRSTIFNNNFD